MRNFIRRYTLSGRHSCAGEAGLVKIAAKSPQTRRVSVVKWGDGGKEELRDDRNVGEKREKRKRQRERWRRRKKT